jgi:hypothetical protein
MPGIGVTPGKHSSDELAGASCVNQASGARRTTPLNRWLIRYGGALLVVVVAFLSRQALVAHLGAEFPAYITFYPAVMLVAIWAGLRPGVLATLLSALLVAPAA